MFNPRFWPWKSHQIFLPTLGPIPIEFRGGIHGLHWRLRPGDSRVAFPQPRMGQNQQRPLGGFEVAGNQKKQGWMMFKICSIVYDVGKTML